MLSYAKLWILLEKKGMKKTDLKQIISSATLAKLGKNETISSTVIEKICEFLECQPGDIMEYISETQVKQFLTFATSALGSMIDQMAATSNISKEQMIEELIKELPNFTNALRDNTLDELWKLPNKETETEN